MKKNYINEVTKLQKIAGLLKENMYEEDEIPTTDDRAEDEIAKAIASIVDVYKNQYGIDDAEKIIKIVSSEIREKMADAGEDVAFYEQFPFTNPAHLDYEPENTNHEVVKREVMDSVPEEYEEKAGEVLDALEGGASREKLASVEITSNQNAIINYYEKCVEDTNDMASMDGLVKALVNAIEEIGA